MNKMLLYIFIAIVFAVTANANESEGIVGWNYGTGKVLYCGLGYMMNDSYSVTVYDKPSSQQLLVNMVNVVSNTSGAIVGVFSGSSNNGNATKLINLLNANGFTASIISKTDIDTIAKIQNYDVIFLGGSGSRIEQSLGYGDVDDEIKDFVFNYSGGVIFTGWANHTISGNLSAYESLIEIIPINISTYKYNRPYTLHIHESGSPLFDNVTSFSGTKFAEWPSGGKKVEATLYAGYAEIPVIENNTGLIVFYHGSEAITSAHLSATISSQDNSTIVYKMTSAPSKGLLTNNDTQINVNDQFTQEDIYNNIINYIDHGYGLDSFKFVAMGSNNYETNEYEFNISIYLESPTLFIGDLSYLPQLPSIAIDPYADIFNWTLPAKLEIGMVLYHEETDELSILTTGNFSISSGDILYDGTLIGTISETSGIHNDGIVNNNTILTIDFTNHVTTAIVEELIRSVAYRNTSLLSDGVLYKTKKVIFALTDNYGVFAQNLSTITHIVPPEDYSYPNGFLADAIEDFSYLQSNTYIIYLPVGTIVDTFFMYGSTPSNLVDHWYEFKYDGSTGAIINGNVITLYFEDGRRGDEDLTVNDIVLFKGGAAKIIGGNKFFWPMFMPAMTGMGR